MARFKKWLPWILVGLAVVAILLFVFRAVPLPGKDPVYKYLEQVNDSLLKVNKGNEAEREANKKIQDSLQYLIDNKEAQIKIIHETIEKRIPVFDTFTVDQLEQFFTERYKP